jgi:hypothetical protein
MKFKVGDAARFPAANLKGAAAIAWKNSNPNIPINKITAFAKVLGALEGSRSYSVAVQGVPQPVTLSSRCLKLSNSLRPHKSNSDDEYDMYDDDDSEPKGSESFEHCDSEDDHVTPQTCALDDVTPSDWRFADALPPDPLYEQHPGFQADQIGRLVLDDVTDADAAMSYFRGLFPLRKLSTCFPAMNEELQDAKGMPKITDGLFIGFIGVLILMSLVDLPSRKLYWDSSVEFLNADAFQEIMPHHVFEKILQVVWKHLPRYAPGDLFLDGRVCTDQDRLQAVRKWYDTVCEYARQNFRASPLLVIDGTMVPRKGPGPHLTHIPRKPCELGVMWRSLCCAVTCVMVSGEFVEEVDVQAEKEGATLYGKTAATTFRVTRPYHDKSRRI